MTEPNTPQDKTHESWRMTLGVMFIAQFLSGVGFSFVLPFFPFYFRELGVDTQQKILQWNGWASLVFGITMTFSAPMWGMLADRYGRKIMVMRSMFAGSIILALMGMATQPWHLLALRIVQGATTGTVTASVTLVSSITPSGNRGVSLGIMHMAILLGAAAGPAIGGVLAELYGFKVSCGLASAIMVIGFLLVVFGARERFEKPKRKKGDSRKAMAAILSTRGFKLIMSIYFLIYVLNHMVIPILPLFIEELSGSSEGAESLTGIIVGATMLISGVSAIIYGRVGDRLGHTRVLVACLVAAGIVSIPQAFAGSVTVLFIERCLFGLAVGGLIPSVNALVSNTISREKIGSAYGLTSAVTCFGIGMGPFIGGIMASYMGLRIPFAVMGAGALVLSVVMNRVIDHGSTGISTADAGG